MQHSSASAASPISQIPSDHNHNSCLQTERQYMMTDVEEMQTPDNPHNQSVPDSPSGFSPALTSQAQRNLQPSSELELQPLESDVRNDSDPPYSLPKAGTPVIARKPVATYSAIPVHDEVEITSQSMWTPLALHWASLTGFALTFAILIVVLEIMYFFSQRDNGLVQADAKNYYLWAYGPTAVLSVLAALWAQVEYRVKQLTPWQALRGAPKTPAETVLLDYVSPWNVIALFKSFKARDYVVAVTITASLLLKLAIVFSTSLLVLEDVMLQNIPVDMTLHDRFDGSNFDPSTEDSTATLTTVGVSVLNLSYPQGTTPTQAYQSFNLSGSATNATSTLLGSVGVFRADLNCESALLNQYSHGPGYLDSGGHSIGIFLQLVSPTCTTANFTGFKHGNGIGNDADAWYGSLIKTKCINLPVEEDVDRLIISTGKFKGNQTLGFTSLICKPIYAISTNAVAISGSGSLRRISSVQNPLPHTLSHVSIWDVVAGINSSMVAASTQVLRWSEGATRGVDATWLVWDTFFDLLNMTTPQRNSSNFLDANLLVEASRRTFSLLGAQVAKQYLMSSTTDTVRGAINHYEGRLVVQRLSLRATETIFGLLILAAVIALFYRPKLTTPRDPGSIVGLSTIVARSLCFTAALRYRGALSLKALKNTLKGRLYKSSMVNSMNQPMFGIKETSSTGEESTSNTETVVQKDNWWRPFSTTTPVRILILLIPVVLIAALEGTYQASKRHNGIGRVWPNDYIHYTWAYIPALIMLGVRAIFDSVDFSIRVLQPYYDLRKGSARAERSIFINYLSGLSIQSLWTALFQRHFAVASASLSMLLAPALTIVVSGLFFTQVVPQRSLIVANRLDWFNATAALGSSSLYRYRGSTVGGVILDTNLAYPQWTADDIVLPQISLEGDLRSLQSPMTFEVKLPGLRGTLNCEIVSPDRVTAEERFRSNTLTVTVKLGTGCGSTGFNSSTFDWELMTMNNVTNGSYFGKFSITDGFQTPNLCPSMVVTYGRANGNSTSEITAAACYPRIDLVDVKTIFTIPSYEIASTSADKDKTSLFLNQFTFDQLSISNGVKQPIPTKEYSYDSIFSAIVMGNTKFPPTPITDMMGPTNFPRFRDVFSRLFGIIIAQDININNRVTTPPPSDIQRTISGSLTSSNSVRLQQSSISTHILEAFLAAMFLCALVAFYTMDSDKVLPLNPCSIAASASLLAGSRMLKPESGIITPGAEWCSDRDLKATKRFEGRTFSLKFWGDETGPQRFGVDVDSDSDSD